MKLIKIKLLTIILFATSFTTVSAQNILVDSLVVKANKAYISKNYDQAITDYEKILNEGFESPELYYNLGNSYYKKGVLGRAILNYEKGLKLAPDNEDLRYNLKIANAHIVDKIETLPEFFIVRWWRSFISLFSIQTLAVALVAVFVMLLIALWLLIFGRTPGAKKGGLFGGGFLLAVFILFIFVYIGKAHEIESSNYAIILTKEVTARTSPDETAKAVFILHEGTKVQVEDKVGDWEQVKLSDGKKGWIKEGTFGVIK